MVPLAHTLALLAMAVVASVAIKVVPLDMAQNSFDDQYRGCSSAMTRLLPALKQSESQKNLYFAHAWAKATAEWQKRGSRVSPLASADQAIAVMAYTMPGQAHTEFNNAVREAGRSPQLYRDYFHFKSFHFLLTQALGTLRLAQKGQCRRVFRGVRAIHFTARFGERVRFGQFTSTSLRIEVAQKFGSDTIFQVDTCHGADIRDFSYFPLEEEVLIPPYETFVVTGVTRVGKSSWIRLRSAGISSKYNCALL